jgi:hypothetical protein
MTIGRAGATSVRTLLGHEHISLRAFAATGGASVISVVWPLTCLEVNGPYFRCPDLPPPEAMWHAALADPDPDDLPPARLRDLGIYGGTQGVWVDASRTQKIPRAFRSRLTQRRQLPTQRPRPREGASRGRSVNTDPTIGVNFQPVKTGQDSAGVDRGDACRAATAPLGLLRSRDAFTDPVIDVGLAHPTPH